MADIADIANDYAERELAERLYSRVKYVGESQRAQRSTAAYMHGYRNGVSDRTGVPHERAEVLRRRAEMIPGITPREEILHG